VTRKVTLTIPDDLGERIDRHRDKLNQSAIFAAAIEKEIEALESPTVEGDLSAVIERLRPQFEEYERRHYRMGFDDGVAWAKTEADYPTLTRLGSAAPNDFVELTSDPGQLDRPMPRALRAIPRDRSGTPRTLQRAWVSPRMD
jgi:hypothetical protein